MDRNFLKQSIRRELDYYKGCLLYTSDAADESVPV